MGHGRREEGKVEKGKGKEEGKNRKESKGDGKMGKEKIKNKRR
jgi:hypothetical protein